MDPLVKVKDPNCNTTLVAFNQSTASAIANICSSDNFSIMPPPYHDMVSANSIELNAATSLSDDSGIPLTTNSSISSGDSYRLGICKFEMEMVESDGEVSQFDSLDNCSEGGMSAENFNTLKKGPLAPIDPPPEFQDSPETTLMRSLSRNIVNSIRRWTSSQSSFEHLKDQIADEMPNLTIDCSLSNNDGLSYIDDDKTLKDSYAINKHLYSSDSILNCHSDNIYDEPNNIISTSLGNSADFIESDSSSPLPPPPPPVSIVKIKQSLCPYYQDHTRYFKAIPSEQDNITAATQKFNVSGLSEIHDYDLYYGTKRNSTQQYDNSFQRKLVYSPLNNTTFCHNHHYHAGMTACGNRPNSRNSLNSRLSSSHNSLSVSSTNKLDDSIFITQAMSHDALLTREISDFYNVPIDSDIYAFPVDMIQSGKKCPAHGYEVAASILKDTNHTKQLNNESCEQNFRCHQQKSHRRHNRTKRKRRNITSCVDKGESSEKEINHTCLSKTMCRSAVIEIGAENNFHSEEYASQEPLHMTLDEVKQFYHTLYSETNSGIFSHRKQSGLTNINKISNESIWCSSSAHVQNNLDSTKEKTESHLKTSLKDKHKIIADKDNINNNKISSNNQNIQQYNPSQVLNATQSDHCQQRNSTTVNNKQTIHSEKKSQFTLNLRQKFCSIFRFRKSQSRSRTNPSETEENLSNQDQNGTSVPVAAEMRKKFQSRALPPLPKKSNSEDCEGKTYKKTEQRAFQFTSSIEKVKDYGWYWGPLSSEAAEKVLSNEPDGSFIVRDSSDDHYIFSLSFKLNNCVRHVRIEQDQGTFSFGSYAKFKSQTITEFIEKAVEHSRSGRYLFFLHRRPEHGPMRVQLTNPVSRFKHVQSLQHMCRFVILKAVIRKDLIQTLPLPRRLLDYLNYKHCYSEQVESDSSQISGEGFP